VPDPAAAARLRSSDFAALAILVALGAALYHGVSTPLAIVAVATGVAIALVAPAAALAAIAAAIPVAYLPVAIGSDHFSPLELAIVVAGLGVGPRLVPRIATSAGRAALRRLAAPLAVTAPAVAILVAATFSLVTVADSAHRHESLREFRLVIAEPLLAFVVARYVLPDPIARRLVVDTLLLVGAIVGVAALVTFAQHAGGLAIGDYRSTVTYPHPNNLAFFLERVATFAIGLAVTEHRFATPTGSSDNLVGRYLADHAGLGRRPSTWLAPITAILALAGGATTLSRGFVLALAIGAAVVVALVGTRRWWRRYLLAVAGVMVFFAAAAWDRLADLGGAGQVPTRVLIWRASLRMALDHPLFGVGLDQFLYQYWPRYVEPAGWPERYTSHPHNVLLDLWLRLGILGAAAFAWLAVAVGRIAARSRVILRQAQDRRAQDSALRYRHTGEEGAVAVGAAAALAAGVAHGLVDNAYFLPDLAAMTWLFVALLELTPAPADPPRSRTEPARAT
jgi:O-antigen ligase